MNPCQRTSPRSSGFAAFLVFLVAGCASTSPVSSPPRSLELTAEYVLEGCIAGGCGLRMDPGAAVDTLLVDASGRIEVRLNDAFAQVPMREEGVEAMYSIMERELGSRPLLTALGGPIEELVPNSMREGTPVDLARRPAQGPAPRPVVRYPQGPGDPARGLAGRHIALWASHGWYYESSLKRWEWQRARLFTTVEDLLPTAFVVPYLAPMLERAGAHVWMPRERDPQTEMVIIDNDAAAGYSDSCGGSGSWKSAQNGFKFPGGAVPSGVNPWEQGTHRWVEAHPNGGCSAVWAGKVSRAGEYAVYVSHGRHERAADRASWYVKHAGGTTRFEVDQSMAQGTWIYAGTYAFAGPVEVGLSNAGQAGTVVSGDAVRLGGGMGLIERDGKTSGRPRWQEGSRYALQFAGMPASLVYNVTDQPESDYVDDYRNRGEWVNYLRGAPLGPNKEPSHPGLGVPVDLSLAFHTDAGISEKTIGTLAIYSSRGNGPDGSEARLFQDGMSRFANRDLADMIQTQLVRDIRARHDSTWSRRSIWDRDYSEAYRPNVPSMLLELLSHQNFADMKLALDPLFRFDVSRAIYKAMTRFLAGQYGELEPVIAPLAPTHLAAVAVDGGVRLSWKSRRDPLEPSAEPTSYRVYMRSGLALGFDNGRTVSGTSIILHPDSALTSYRVTALNDGGESAWSETVAVQTAATPDSQPRRILVVTGFDRLGPPSAVDEDGWQGFPEYLDQGVPDGRELAFVGSQHEFRAGSPWKDDDEPGHGASHADWEAIAEWGNTFDYAARMGRRLVEAGLGDGFDTMSDEAVEETGIDPARYGLVYVMLGEERGQVEGHADRPQFRPFSTGLQRALRQAKEGGVALLVSGSYTTEELEQGSEADQLFLSEVLGVRHRAARASRAGEVYWDPDDAMRDEVTQFNQDRRGRVYAAENPEAIVPASSRGVTLLRYQDSNMSAAVAADRTVTLGFPLEVVTDRAQLKRLLGALVSYLERRP